MQSKGTAFIGLSTTGARETTMENRREGGGRAVQIFQGILLVWIMVVLTVCVMSLPG